jgi:hypothetical protein
MKTLIIHPDDRSTDFLRPIYQNIKGATVLTKNISKDRLEKEIKSHDQILMLGHGSPYGLLNLAGIGDGLYAVGEKQVPLLRDKRCIFIWCNADVFVKRYQLKGLYTGMFISEVREAEFCNVPVDQDTIDTSNSRFADILGGTLTDDSPDYKMIFEHVKTSYEELALENKIANYNNQRWYFEPEVAPTLRSKIKGVAQKIFFLAVLVSSLSSCSPYVYEVTYYQGIENTGVLASSTLIYMPSKDNNCWDWYKETTVFKEMMPKSDSVTILYWGTRKELRAMGR